MAITLTEGTLTVDQACRDESITLLRFSALSATLVVTRAWDLSATQREGYLAQQLAVVEQRTNHFRMEPSQPAMLGSLPAEEVALTFEQNGATLVQRLLVAELDDHLLILNFSRATDFDDAALAAWQQIKQSFIPRHEGELAL
ncbi:DcrB-related protein [Rosenbergiella epipactidis]|uniref:DcrB-related protein n=1 Tax=Rosenbergiella epipactidis TaxID=1544694 RepID=UPI001F4EA774|nr:DcrB-related protein [Rosenbergiella epipactidis]